MKQIGTATLMYAQDYDDLVHRGFNTWHLTLAPYTKNWQIFVCPSSTAPAPEVRNYTNVPTDTGPQTGAFLSNLPATIPGTTFLSATERQMPLVFGNYARNNEWIQVTGQRYLRMSAWNAPAQEILYTESRAGSEDDDTNDWDDDNAPYLDPDGTTWNQMFRGLSARHMEGSNVAYADGHVKWHRHDWFKTMDGRIALNWFMRGCTDGEGWSTCQLSETPPF